MKKWISLALLLLAALVVLPGWLADHPDVVVGLAVAAAFVVVGLAVAAGILLGGAWTIRNVRTGAEIALQAQQIDNAWDARKTQAFAGLARAMLPNRQGQANPPALPLPGQDSGAWLPQLTEFVPLDGDVVDAEEV